MNNLALADYAVIAGFFAVLIGIGFYFQGRMKTVSDFFGGGKRVPWWLGGISFYMCSFSALGFVVYSALAYQYGWVAVTIYWLTVPSMFIGAWCFASRWRRVAETSPLEYIETRYGNKMRQGLVWLGIPTRILDDALKLLAIGTVIAVGLGFPLTPAIIISGVIMISYTFMGGLWAALVADFIQFVVLIAAVIVLPFLVIGRVGGISGFIEQAPPDFFAFTNQKYTWGYILFFFFIILLNYSSSWALVQRYYSADSDRNAKKVGYLVAVLNFVGPPIFYIPAMAARVFIPDIENTNEVYAIVCKTVLPVGMLGMVIAAMFSATMSMLAGDFNAVASVLTNDVYKRMIAKDAAPRKLLMVSRINTLIIGFAVIGITFYIRKMQGSDDLFRVMVKIFGLFLPPVAIPMLLGMLIRRIHSFGALLGLWGGILVGLGAFGLGYWYPVLRTEIVITSLTTGTTLLGMVLGSVMRPDSQEQREKVRRFFEQVRTGQDTIEHTGEIRDASNLEFLPLISIGILVISLILILFVGFTVPFEQGWISHVVGLGMILFAGLIWIPTGKIKKRTRSKIDTPTLQEEHECLK